MNLILCNRCDIIMMMDVREEKLSKRLRETRKKAGLSRQELATRAGISTTALYYYEKGNQIPNAQILSRLSRELHVSTDYLLGNVDDPDSNVLKNILDQMIAEGIEKEKKKLRPVPVYDGAHAGDVGVFPDNLTPQEIVTIPKDSPGKYGVIVHGDSMSPVIDDGDIVVVETEMQVEHGQRAVVFVDGGLMVKTVFYNNNSIILSSINPKYPPIVIDKSKGPVYILGKVVWILKREP